MRIRGELVSGRAAPACQMPCDPETAELELAPNFTQVKLELEEEDEGEENLRRECTLFYSGRARIRAQVLLRYN